MSLLDEARGIDPIDGDGVEFQRRAKIKFVGATVTLSGDTAEISGLGGAGSDPTTVDDVGGGGSISIKKDRVGSSERVRGLIGTGGINTILSADGNRIEIDGSNISSELAQEFLLLDDAPLEDDIEIVLDPAIDLTHIDLAITTDGNSHALTFDTSLLTGDHLVFISGFSTNGDLTVELPGEGGVIFRFIADFVGWCLLAWDNTAGGWHLKASGSQTSDSDTRPTVGVAGDVLSYLAASGVGAEDIDLDETQAAQGVLNLEEGKWYLVTAIAIATDAAGGAGAVVHSQVLTGMFYRPTGGSALNVTDTPTGEGMPAYEATPGDFTFELDVTGNTVIATLENVSGGANCSGKVRLTHTEMPLP